MKDFLRAYFRLLKKGSGNIWTLIILLVIFTGGHSLFGKIISAAIFLFLIIPLMGCIGEKRQREIESENDAPFEDH